VAAFGVFDVQRDRMYSYEVTKLFFESWCKAAVGSLTR